MKFDKIICDPPFCPSACKDALDLIEIKSLFLTKTARYLMAIKQKGLFVMGFECVPDYKELEPMLFKSGQFFFTDQWFYETFNFSEELIDEIEWRVSTKEI